MNLRIIIIYCIILASVVLFSSCFSSPVKNDLVNYADNEIIKIAELESKVAYEWESVSGENYKGDQTVYNALSESIINNSGKLVDEARKIMPKTKELKEIHNLYVSAVDEQHDAFIAVKSALEEGGDTRLIDNANEKLKKARELMKEYMEKIDALARKHNIDFS